MAVYELRTYTLQVGKLAEAVEHYRNEGWPALQKHPAKLVGYFTGDVGALERRVDARPQVEHDALAHARRPLHEERRQEEAEDRGARKQCCVDLAGRRNVERRVVKRPAAPEHDPVTRERHRNRARHHERQARIPRPAEVEKIHDLRGIGHSRNHEPEREQDRRAAILYQRTGPSSWPVCGR